MHKYIHKGIYFQLYVAEKWVFYSGYFVVLVFENCYLPFFAPRVMRIRPSVRTNIDRDISIRSLSFTEAVALAYIRSCIPFLFSFFYILARIVCKE